MKQAVVVVHGMGEQIPMQTLQGFVEAVWVTDNSLIDPDRPDSATGGKRKGNAVWSKPDDRYRSYELRRLTTESVSHERGPTDFYEFYWAHLMHGTAWEHVQAWLFDLLWRWPHRVPKGVRSAWVLLWVITLAVVAVIVVTWLATGQRSWWQTILAGAGSIAVGAFVSTYLLKYFGDVARYVKAKPPNVARRQEIREKGVELLETLMRRGPDGKKEYDRIVVVAHSLGTIVAYDILCHSFARLNTEMMDLAGQPQEKLRQPERAKLEAMVRVAAGLPDGSGSASQPAPDIDAFQAQQALCRSELNRFGNPWIVSDFVTLGSPLAHAEFLLAYDKADLRSAQERRILATCPPTLEYDGKTKLRHFSYRPPLMAHGDDKDVQAPRLPHHAALFAYTRWTNLYSPHAAILWGDIISGPVGSQFNLSVDGREVAGIRDVAVLPERDPAGRPRAGTRVPFFSHGKYWQLPKADPGSGTTADVPHHIRELRAALNLRS